MTYTATVTKTSGSGALSGVMSFSGKGGSVQGCSNLPVSGGKASCTITFGTQGTFTIKAVYSGDPYFTSSSDFVTQSVSSSGAPTFTSPSSDTATAGTEFDFDVTTSGTPDADDHRDRCVAQRAAIRRQRERHRHHLGSTCGRIGRHVPTDVHRQEHGRHGQAEFRS